MTYLATVVQLLLSSPSDLPLEHKEVVIRAVRAWNNSRGRRLSVIFSPTNWEEGSSPEYGTSPQKSLNRQIVDTSDAGLAIFTDRLGQKTDTHLSGTVEEVELLHGQGKTVGVLRNLVPRSSATGSEAAEQRAALEAYFEGIKDKALYRTYDSLDGLLGIVSRFLDDIAHETESPADRSETTAERFQNELAIGVWPTVEVESYQETDNKGRLRRKTRPYLVLTNGTGVPVTNVSFRYEDAQGNPEPHFSMRNDHDPIGIMAPGTAQRFHILQSMGSPGSAMAVVSWTGPDGTERETRATVSTY